MYFDFEFYQKRALETDGSGESNMGGLSPKWLYHAMGLSDEVGEVLGKIKKIFRDKGGRIDRDEVDAIILEMGDVLWYMATLCHHLGIDFSEVPKRNIQKLSSRAIRDKIHGSGDNR